MEISARQITGLSLLSSGVPLVDSVRVTNLSLERLDHIRFELTFQPLGGEAQIVVPSIHPGESIDIGAITMAIPPERLANTLRQPAQLSWRLLGVERVLKSGSLPIDVLPWDEWPGEQAPVSVLASFVSPDDSVVAVIVRRLTSAKEGASHRPVWSTATTVSALFGAIRALGLRESPLSPSFESEGARLRTPGVMLSEQRASSLEIALLFASCLERLGFAPILLSAGGLVLPGLWLSDDRFPEGVVYDPPRVRAVRAQLLWFDPRQVFPEGGSFEGALASAERLSEGDGFRWLMDIRTLRADKIMALQSKLPAGVSPKSTIRTGRPIVQEILAEAVKQPVVSVSVAQSAITIIDDPVATRFRQWKDRLLDLSLRNRLLAFRLDARTTLPLELDDLPRFADLLSDRTGSDTVIEILPRSKQTELIPLAKTPEPSEEDDTLVLEDLEADDLPTEEVETLTLPAHLAARSRSRLDDSPPPPISEPTSAEERALAQGKVHAKLPADERFSRAVGLERAARTHLEEGGANTLFVALGFLMWGETGTLSPQRCAPLLLVPVSLELVRSSRTVKLRRLAEDPVANVTLVEKLRRDFDLDLSKIADFETEERAIDIEAVLERATAAVARMPSWQVVRGAALGQFVFGKFLLWRDLEDNAQKLLENPVVQHIARCANIPFPNPVQAPDPRALDRNVPPRSLPLVLDADSTQMAAIWGALQGRSFVLQGPPGTGKSQTIANLVAAAVASGKTVLVVAEKMAALDVVHRRLKACGLGEICLELHSHKTSKRQVISSLAAALKRDSLGAPPAWEERTGELKQCRDDLNAYVQALHTVRANGSTFYTASAQQLSLREGPIAALALSRPADLSDAEIRTTGELVMRFATAARLVEPVPAHPWRDTELGAWTAGLEESVLTKISKAIDTIGSVQNVSGELAALFELGSAAITSPAHLDTLAALGTELGRGTLPPPALDRSTAFAFAERVRSYVGRSNTWTARSRTVSQRWHPMLYELDLEALYQRFARFSESWFPIAFLMLFFARRELLRATRRSLPDNRSIATDLSLAREASRMREPLASERRALVAEARGAWPGSDAEELVKLTERAEALLEKLEQARVAGLPVTDAVLAVADPASPGDRRKILAKRSAEASRAIERLRTALNSLSEMLGADKSTPDRPLAATMSRLQRWQANIKRLRDWSIYCELGAELAAHDLRPLASLHRSGEVEASALHTLFERSLRKLWLDQLRDTEPALRSFSGADRHRQVVRFRRLDQSFQRLSQAHVLHNVQQRAPKLNAEVAETSEPGILMRESAKKTRQKSVRRLLAEIPNLVARLKPCLLMSPLSVAQYLPADGRRFDLVVFDEASQIGTHDAIGALARGTQVVVVGDSHQLPPTTFFQRSGDEPGDENDFDELESILDEAVASGLPEQMLGWHYRSRHESLIRFSNEHYYGGQLAVFPAAHARVNLGLRWHPVPHGVYDKSRTRTNRAEATALVEHLVASLTSSNPAARSFGVVTFSAAQQVLVSDLLDEARRLHPEIEGHFAHDEAVFVKNLENVQGDERDEILFSIGYGPDERGVVWMNFGPLNREGGERRLNVAVTRARQQLHVFSTLTHHHIDLARTKARGARHLKAFLRYAAEQSAPAQHTEEDPSCASRFEQEVRSALIDSGHRVVTAVGCGEYRIDLVVLHPEDGSYLLGIELDGESYRRAATARDRDRLRAEVLAGLGWRLHRVWSLDWWYSREREIERLSESIREALSGAPPQPEEPVELVTPLSSAPREQVSPEPAPHTAFVRAPVRVEPYVAASPSAVSDDAASLHDAAHLDELRRVVQQVIDVEGPIHIALLTRRVALAFGVAKVTARAQRRVLAAAKKLSPAPPVHGNILWPTGIDPARWDRVRTGSRAPEHLPPEEVAAAVVLVLAGNLAMPYADLVKATAKQFGISRVGKKAAKAMEDGIAVLVAQGGAEVRDDRIVGR